MCVWFRFYLSAVYWGDEHFYMKRQSINMMIFKPPQTEQVLFVDEQAALSVSYLWWHLCMLTVRHQIAAEVWKQWLYLTSPNQVCLCVIVWQHFSCHDSDVQVLYSFCLMFVHFFWTSQEWKILKPTQNFETRSLTKETNCKPYLVASCGSRTIYFSVEGTAYIWDRWHASGDLIQTCIFNATLFFVYNPMTFSTQFEMTFLLYCLQLSIFS